MTAEFRVDHSLAEKRKRPCNKPQHGSADGPHCGSPSRHDQSERRSTASPLSLSQATNGQPSIGHPIQQLINGSVSENRETSLSAQANGSENGALTLPRRRFATLDQFVVGSTNRLAHASAFSAIEHPGKWSPLFLHGPHGCGKTHLLEGIWTAARRRGEGMNAVYLSAEQFTTLFVAALRGSGLPNFRRKYRGVELLLIDDLQFFSGKKATLVELLHTVDVLLREGRQLVFAADRGPSELSQLGPQLTTRLSGGMVVKVESPDLQTRLGLVHHFAQRLNIVLADEVAELIATQITAGARELSGAVNRLHATGRMLNCAIDPAFAEETLAELLHTGSRAVRLADIERAVCGVFGLDKNSLQSDRRAKRVSTPRMLAMWLARKYTRAGLTEIGHYFGRRSHSTVISAQKRVTDWMADQSEIELSHARCKIDEAVRRVEAQLRTG